MWMLQFCPDYLAALTSECYHSVPTHTRQRTRPLPSVLVQNTFIPMPRRLDAFRGIPSPSRLASVSAAIPRYHGTFLKLFKKPIIHPRTVRLAATYLSPLHPCQTELTSQDLAKLATSHTTIAPTTHVLVSMYLCMAFGHYRRHAGLAAPSTGVLPLRCSLRDCEAQQNQSKSLNKPKIKTAMNTQIYSRTRRYPTTVTPGTL